MKNMSSVGLLWMWQWSSQIRKRRATHSNSARHGVLFCEPLRSHKGVEDYALSTGVGLRTFRFNVVSSSWADGPEGEGKLISRQGATSHMTWIFTNTAVRMSQPPTVVPKRRQETTNRRWVKSQNSATKHLCTNLHFNVRNKLSYESACATVIQPKGTRTVQADSDSESRRNGMSFV